MNIVSLNIRGLGETRKRDWVQSLCRLHKASFFGLQETHLDRSLNREMIRECWGDYNFEFAYENASGRSGGLVSIWDRNYFTSSEVIKSRSFFYCYWYLFNLLLPGGICKCLWSPIPF